MFKTMQAVIYVAATVVLSACGGTDGGTNSGANGGANGGDASHDAVSLKTMQSQEKLGTTPAKMVLAYYSGYTGNYRSLTKYYGNFNAASIDYWNITSQGEVVGNGDDTPTDAMAFLKQKKIPAYACISNVDGDWSPSIAHSVTGSYRSTAISNLVSFAKKNGMAGINLDFENVAQADRANLSAFVSALASALHASGLKLIVSVPAFSSTDETNPYNYAYDLAALGKAVDYLQIMTYDETIPDWPAGPVAGSDWMENDLDYATSKVSPTKILNGIPAYGYDWIKPGDGSQLYWNATPALLKKYGVTPKYDNNTNSETFTYTASGAKHTVWTENVQSVTLKAGLVNAYGLGGTSLYALGMEDANFWSAVTAGLQQQ
jgi:spore germination protein